MPVTFTVLSTFKYLNLSSSLSERNRAWNVNSLSIFNSVCKWNQRDLVQRLYYLAAVFKYLFAFGSKWWWTLLSHSALQELTVYHLLEASKGAQSIGALSKQDVYGQAGTWKRFRGCTWGKRSSMLPLSAIWGTSSCGTLTPPVLATCMSIN